MAQAEELRHPADHLGPLGGECALGKPKGGGKLKVLADLVMDVVGGC